ncbi:MAG: molybdopterin-dependent oxidoreductase [Desulfomonilaceae bacterium]
MIDYLPLKRFPGSRKPYDDAVNSVCQECGVGCGFVAYLEQGRIVDIQGEEGHPISRGRLCARGVSFSGLLSSYERLEKPIYRKSPKHDPEEFENWETGLDLLAERLKRTRDINGPEALLIGCDPEAGLDFYYGAKRFAELWGTPYVINPLDEPTRIHERSFSNSLCYEWLNSACILLVGADPASTHPVAFGWILEAQRRGTKIAVVDTRFTATMSKADFAFTIRPESENAVGMALMKILLNQESYRTDLIQERFLDSDSWLESFERMDIATAIESTGVSNQKIEELARLMVKTQPVQLITSKKLAFLKGYGIWETMAEAMGWSRVRGGGWYPLDSGRPIIDVGKDIRSSGKSDSSTTIFGYSDAKNLLAKADSGHGAPIKAVICSGNCIDDYFAPLERYFDSLELVAYFGAFQNQTCSISHLAFPAALRPERDNLYFTNDRAVCWAKKIVSPKHNFRSGLDFWMGLADRLGFGEHFPWKTDQNQPDHRAFCNWVLSQSPLTSALNVDLLESASADPRLVTWPYVADDSEEDQRLKPLPIPRQMQPTFALPYGEITDKDSDDSYSFPLNLEFPSVISRSLVPDFEQYSSQRPGATYNIQLNPETAESLGINTGDIIYVHGPRKIVEAVAWINRATPRGMVYSNRPIGENRVLVYRKGESSEAALSSLKELLALK